MPGKAHSSSVQEERDRGTERPEYPQQPTLESVALPKGAELEAVREDLILAEPSHELFPFDEKAHRKQEILDQVLEELHDGTLQVGDELKAQLQEVSALLCGAEEQRAFIKGITTQFKKVPPEVLLSFLNTAQYSFEAHNENSEQMRELLDVAIEASDNYEVQSPFTSHFNGLLMLTASYGTTEQINRVAPLLSQTNSFTREVCIEAIRQRGILEHHELGELTAQTMMSEYNMDLGNMRVLLEIAPMQARNALTTLLDDPLTARTIFESISYDIQHEMNPEGISMMLRNIFIRKTLDRSIVQALQSDDRVFVASIGHVVRELRLPHSRKLLLQMSNEMDQTDWQRDDVVVALAQIPEPSLVEEYEQRVLDGEGEPAFLNALLELQGAKALPTIQMTLENNNDDNYFYEVCQILATHREVPEVADFMGKLFQQNKREFQAAPMGMYDAKSTALQEIATALTYSGSKDTLPFLLEQIRQDTYQPQISEALKHAAETSPHGAKVLYDMLEGDRNPSMYSIFNTVDLDTCRAQLAAYAVTEANEDTRAQLEAYEEALKRCPELGIRKPLRLHPEALIAIVENRIEEQRPLAPGEKVAVVAIGREDEHGAFYGFSKQIEQLRAQQYRILYYEVSNVFEETFRRPDTNSLVGAAHDAWHRTQHDFDLLLLAGHGNRNSIAFGAPDPRLDLQSNSNTLLHRDDIEKLRKTGLGEALNKESGKVVTISCSVGEGGLSENPERNILRELRNLFKDNIPQNSIFGGQYPTQSLETDFIFDENGTLIDVHYSIPRLITQDTDGKGTLAA